MSKKLVPNHGQAILKPIEEGEQSYGNIIIPDLGNSKSMQAIVVDIAPIYNFNMGTFAPMKFKIGDVVLFPSMGSQKVTLDREDFYVCSITDIPASIETIEE